MRHDLRVDASCPRCGAAAAPGASSCRACGFGFLDAHEPRRVPWRPLAAAAAVLAATAIAVVALTRDSPPGPVDAAGAGERLAAQLRDAGVADVHAVECGDDVGRGTLTRCEARYRNGDTQLLLVVEDANGELDVQNPYPAQRRPGG
ncbi:MAG: hypothetical protein JW895_08835 [Thermoleophilaceae bacterium]|nr:hypothetical protein [Thermoleophilaceae bacterium]